MGVIGGVYFDRNLFIDSGKKRFRSLLWRVRAEIRRQVKSRSNKRFSFNYDPFSYALNFDNGDSGFLCI